MQTSLVQTIRATPNKGRMHVFLGHPASDACDKTTVEPGNTFSPGLWTCGVSLWIETGDGRLWTPDMLPDDAVVWGFDGDDGPPVLRTRWAAGDSLRADGTLCHLGGPGAEGRDFCAWTVANVSQATVDAACFLVVRDAGPAGGKIAALAWDQSACTLQVGGGPALTPAPPPDGVEIVPAGDGADSPLALLRWPLRLTPGETWTLDIVVRHGFAGRAFAAQVPPVRMGGALSVAEGVRQARDDWAAQLPARVYAPDPRLARVWERSAYHLLAAMDNSLPRIGVANYPAFWMRDGVLVLRALDLLGRADLGRTGCEYLAPLIFSGGFGAESDAPGEGLWALVGHARLTGDWPWLERHWAAVEERVAWLERMLEAGAPIRRVGENVLPAYSDTPGLSILCLAASDGLIRGRMDWHAPDFYINCWAVAGLRQASDAAQALGKTGQENAWRERADRLEEALARRLLPAYGNERDPVVAPHPTEALPGHRDVLREAFARWYQANRLDESGTRRPEHLWTYFEVAQTHNAFRLGLDDLAWTNLDALLGEGGTPQWDVSAFPEGVPGGAEYLPFGNGAARRGWLDPQAALGGNMPHGWTAAEWIMLLRGLFVRDDGPRLVLGPRVLPAAWHAPGAAFGVRALPTRFGPVTFRAALGENGRWTLDYDGPPDYETGWA